MAFEEAVRRLNLRIQAASLVVMVLGAGVLVPMAVERSNGKPAHLPTVVCAYLAFLTVLCLRGLVSEFLAPAPGRRRYLAAAALVHAAALALVALAFSLSLMTRVAPAAATAPAAAAAAAFVAHRLRRCAPAPLEADLAACLGREGSLQRLLDLAAGVTSMLFGGWFGVAFYCFQNNDHPERARDAAARFLPAEYLTFLTSVAASLLLVKAVPRGKAERSARELTALACALVAAVAATCLAVAASEVRGYAVIALAPEAVALGAWWCARPAAERHLLPVTWPAEWLEYGGGAGDKAGDEEPSSQGFVSVSLALLMAVLSYRAKDARALFTLYDDVFVLVTAAAVVAALGWRLLAHAPTPAGRAPGLEAAAKVLGVSTFWLLLLSVLSFFGVMLFGW